MSQRELLFALDARPPAATSLLAGLQHLLAVFGGIVTAPLIIALGMGLSPADTNYLVTSALLISGVATCVQVGRFGGVGSGLLSVQGTSFTFVGPILFAFHSLPAALDSSARLAIIFGCCALAAALMMVLSLFLAQLQRVFTATVTGATVVLLGSTLVWTTLTNLYRAYGEAAGRGAGWTVLFLAILVFATTLFMARRRNPWLRLCSIVSGLGAGYFAAMALGLVDFSPLGTLQTFFVPSPLHFGIGFDWGVFLILMPIFIVSATESIGDLTATSALSRQPTAGPAYWQRIRGGILGDALNSLLSSLFATFPNTTFSQNNGVIQLTGIASRRIGFVVAALLVVLGLFPIVGGLFQVVPGAVLYGSTLLMFIFVALAGVGILRRGAIGRRGWVIAAIAVVLGWGISLLAGRIEAVPPQFAMLLQFPVSTGAFIAMLLELSLPSRAQGEAAGSVKARA